MGRKSTVRFAATVSLCATTALLYGCAQDTGGHATAAAPVVAQATTETPQERSLRIRDELVRLGCDTNSCIQTYFACEDGLLSGEACEFYRQHPLK
ncbi:hypothetical protein [Nocardia carnea]|uniref:hypothetical protein n=1 Tax=Nocardia carnea TaxID=37328 RepID=UPI002458B94E|nr:hypothetical protein [Nocardia carnea]